MVAATMRQRSLGGTGIQVGEIGLGTWGISGEGYGAVEEPLARRTLDVALDEGCNLVETCDAYANGAVERWIGDAIRSRGRDKLVVSTRIGVDRSATPPMKRFAPKYLRAACEGSLRRLGVEAVDCLVLHNPQIGTLTQGEAMETLRALKSEGKARAIGVSASTTGQALAAIDQATEILVLPYNLYFPSVLHGISGYLGGAKVGVIARSPLAYGLLADTWAASRRFDDDDHRLYRWGPADIAARIRQREDLRTLVRGDITTLRAAAIRYVLSNGLVSCAVPGARTPEQAAENAHCADVLPYLNPDDMASMGKLLASIGAM
jgi:aryl-alcohol dehydrogenase-like predicted oxidoreductase